jgi:hypothetical protein
VFPVVLGDGERIFGTTSDKTPLRLRGARALGTHLVLLTYDVLRD